MREIRTTEELVCSVMQGHESMLNSVFRLDVIRKASDHCFGTFDHALNPTTVRSKLSSSKPDYGQGCDHMCFFHSSEEFNKLLAYMPLVEA